MTRIPPNRKRKASDTVLQVRRRRRSRDGRFENDAIMCSLRDFLVAGRSAVNDNAGDHGTDENKEYLIDAATTCSVGSDMSGDDRGFTCCENCRRWSYLENDIDIQEVARIENNFHYGRKLCFLDAKSKPEDSVWSLCQECRIVILAGNGDRERNLWKNVWPSWMWMLLTSDKVLQHPIHDGLYANEIWAMLPTTWRKWWIESLVRRAYWLEYGIHAGTESVTKKRLKDLYFNRHDTNRVWRVHGDDVILKSYVPDLELVVGGLDFIERCVREHYEMTMCDEGTDMSSTCIVYKNAQCSNREGIGNDITEIDYEEYSMSELSGFDENRPYGVCSMDYPVPLIVDCTKEYNDVREKREKNVAASILDHMQHDLKKIDISCPWGCTDFVHKCGKVPLYGLFRHFLQEEIWTEDLLTSAGIFHVNASVEERMGYDLLKGARDDYFEDRDMLPSLNGESFIPLRRCIRMDPDIGPVLMVCHYHDEGSTLRYIHPPINPATLSFPCKYGDQLTHVVLAPRKIKTTQSHAYNTNYSVNVVQGRYTGIDSCDIQEFGRFDKTSQLMADNQALMLYHRDDIREVLQQWNRREIVSDGLKDAMLERMKESYGEPEDRTIKCWAGKISKKRALKGCTFVSLIDAFLMEKITKERKEAVFYVRKEEKRFGTTVITEEKKYFFPSWPQSIVHVHPLSNHGAVPTTVARYRVVNQDTFVLWAMSILSTNVNEVWESIVDMETRNRDWFGWFLAFTLHGPLKYVRQRGSGDDNPYKTRQKTEFVLKKMFPACENRFATGRDFGDCFKDLSNCKVIHCECFPLPSPLPSVDDDTTVIVLYRNNVRRDRRPWTSFKINEKTYDLRFASARCIHDRTKLHEWSAVVNIRHRESMFNEGWWEYVYNRSRNVSKEGGVLPYKRQISTGFHRQIEKGWNILVYVRYEKDVHTMSMRENYMTSFGGQMKLKCSKHNYFLVSTLHGTKHRCNADGCSRVADLECPCRQCACYLCKIHRNEEEGRYCIDDPVYVHPIVTKDERSVPHSKEKPPPNVYESDSSEEIVMQEAHHTRSVDKFIPDKEIDDVSDDDSDHSLNWMTGERNDSSRDKYMYEGIQDISDDRNVSMSSTLASADIKMAMIGESGPRRIKSHVLLNADGYALIRRGVRLTSLYNRKENAFLQRIISTTERSLPLIYPEGDLHPSIFWKKNSTDGSTIGALPSCCWADENVTSQMNVAGFHSHLISRIINPTLLCGSDTRYISNGFDVYSNIQMRGRDSRMVMERGFGDYGDTHGLSIVGKSYSKTDGENVYSPDFIDSNLSVKCLGAQLYHHMSTYLVTRTVNMKEHPGLAEFHQLVEKAKASLLEAITGASAVQEYIEAMKEHCCIPTVRIWNECHTAVLYYILYSTDQIFGKVEEYFSRNEIQESFNCPKGDVCHNHLLIYSKRTEGDNDEVNERIQCSSRTVFTRKNVQELLDLGLIDDEDELTRFQELLRKINPHSCERCGHRCTKISSSDGQMYCKCVHFGRENPDNQQYCEQEIELNHSQFVLDILERLKVVTLSDSRDKIATYIDKRLKATTHLYPSEVDEHFCPLNHILFLLTRSVCNAKITGEFLNSRYLCSYLAMIEEGSKVYVGAKRDTGNLQLDRHFTYNTKHTGSRIASEKKDQSKRYRNRPKGRLVGVPEMVNILLGHSTVKCSSTFVNIPSVSLECRKGMKQMPDRILPKKYEDKYSKQERVTVAISGLVESRTELSAVRGRLTLNLPSWRQFTVSQRLHIADQSFSDVTIDATTSFCVRPPELYFIDSQTDYIRSFSWQKEQHVNKAKDIDDAIAYFKSNHHGMEPTRQQLLVLLPTITERYVQPTLHESQWIDGFEYIVRIRKPAISFILKKYWSKLIDIKRTDTLAFFLALYRCFNETNWVPENYEGNFTMVYELQIGPIDPTKFIDKKFTRATMPLPMYGSIRPSTIEKFLIHIILSMGKFNTEVELWNADTLKQVFINAKLIRSPTEENPLSLDDLNPILLRYMREQLNQLPKGSAIWGKYLVQADYVLTETLIHDRMPSMNMPSFLFTTLQLSAEERLQNALTNTRRSIFEALIPRMFESYEHVPSIDEWMNVSKSNPMTSFKVTLKRVDENQSNASLYEQQMTFSSICDGIHDYINGTCTVRNRIVTGKPGCGKTHVAKLALLYGMSQGLLIVPTCLVQERAREFGSWHIHHLFGLKKSDGMDLNQIVDRAIGTIVKSPEKRFILRVIDGLFIDECGLNASLMFAAMDRILRFVRESTEYMAGLLIFMTMDYEQNGPVSGKPMLLHANVLSNYKIIELMRYVRNRNDQMSQELNDLARKSVLSNDERKRFLDIFVHNCTFVKSWDDDKISNRTVRVLGTHYGTQQAEEAFLQQMSTSDSSQTIVKSIAVDTECTKSSIDNWKPASKRTIAKLNRLLKEVEVLNLYPKALFAMTTNNKDIWSQGQFAFLKEVPSQTSVKESEDEPNSLSLSLLLAPSGVKTLPNDTSATNLLQLGWKEIQVKRYSTAYTHKINDNIIGRRNQFPLLPRIACTNHKAMGCDFFSVATAVSLHSKNMGYIWLRSQVIVLLSRTFYLKDLIFVDPQLTPELIGQILLAVLDKKPQFYNYMKTIMDVRAIRFDINVSDNISSVHTATLPVVKLNDFPYRPMDITLPSANSSSTGYTYLLLSRKNPNKLYIGSTTDIGRRYNQHNRNNPERSVDSNEIWMVAFQPWTLLAYICGFDSLGNHQRLELEIQRSIKHHDVDSARELVLRSQEIMMTHTNVTSQYEYYGNLVFVECAKENVENASESTT